MILHQSYFRLAFEANDHSSELLISTQGTKYHHTIAGQITSIIHQFESKFDSSMFCSERIIIRDKCT